MQSKGVTSVLFGAAVVAVTLLSAPAHAALQDRDLDGNGVTDAFYDTDLNITWLRDANVNGSGDWDTAVNWASAFSIGGYDDWRLPTVDPCGTTNCTGSEMGHLWYVELGNSGSITNTGGFQNLQTDAWYWGIPELYATEAPLFYMFSGYQTSGDKANIAYGMAVRNGDVLAVPEPETYALMLAGLGVLGFVARRRNA